MTIVSITYMHIYIYTCILLYIPVYIYIMYVYIYILYLLDTACTHPLSLGNDSLIGNHKDEGDGGYCEWVTAMMSKIVQDIFIIMFA